MHRAGPPAQGPRRPSGRARLFGSTGMSRWTGAVIGVVAVAVLVGGTLTVRSLAGDHGHTPPAAGPASPGATQPVAAGLSQTPTPASSTPKPAPRASSAPA